MREIKTGRNHLQYLKNGKKKQLKNKPVFCKCKATFLTSKMPFRFIFTKLVAFVSLDNLSYKRRLGSIERVRKVIAVKLLIDVLQIEAPMVISVL